MNKTLPLVAVKAFKAERNCLEASQKKKKTPEDNEISSTSNQEFFLPWPNDQVTWRQCWPTSGGSDQNQSLPKQGTFILKSSSYNKRIQQSTHRVILTDVVDGACTELSIELFGSQAPEVMDGEGPEVQHIISGKGVSFFNQNNFAAQQGQLDGCPQTAWAASNDETLNGAKRL